MRIILVNVEEGIAASFAGEAEFEVIDPSASADADRIPLGELDPDVVLLDVGRGTVTKWTAAQISGLSRETEAPIVVRSRSRTSTCVTRALGAGAQAYVLPSEPFETLCLAVRAAARGEVWVSGALQPMVLGEIAEAARRKTTGPQSGRRESGRSRPKID